MARTTSVQQKGQSVLKPHGLYINTESTTSGSNINVEFVAYQPVWKINNLENIYAIYNKQALADLSISVNKHRKFRVCW